jgi:hypothetical protein
LNSKEYFDTVSKELDNLSDNEFMNLLKESGLDRCPYEDEIINSRDLTDEEEYAYKIGLESISTPTGLNYSEECENKMGYKEVSIKDWIKEECDKNPEFEKELERAKRNWNKKVAKKNKKKEKK